MKAMALREPGPIDSSPLELREVPTPEPKAGEIRLRVLVCALCRTDLHVIEGDLPPHRPHIIPGHQVVGTVDRLGDGVTKFKIGDRAGIAWLRHTCGQCRYCKAQKENLCPYAKFTGYDEDGGYAQYAVISENFAYHLPATIDPATISPILCAGIIGYRALKARR